MPSGVEITSNGQSGVKKRQVFKTPLIVFNKQSAQSNNDKRSQGKTKTHSKKSENHSIQKSNKNKKHSSQPDYYKGLENFVLRPSNTSKLRFWSRNKETLEQPLDINCTRPKEPDNVSDSQVFLVNEQPQLPEETSASVITYDRSSKVSRREYTTSKKSIASQSSRRSSRTKLSNISSVKKSRLNCGKQSCLPCSIISDCGDCIPCLNKETKK